MASSPYEREQIDRLNPPIMLHHPVHGTPSVPRTGQNQFEAAHRGGPIIPAFSMMNKTINATKQFESQDEWVPHQPHQNQSIRNSRNVGQDSSFNEWQSKFDQPTS